MKSAIEELEAEGKRRSKLKGKIASPLARNGTSDRGRGG